MTYYKEPQSDFENLEDICDRVQMHPLTQDMLAVYEVRDSYRTPKSRKRWEDAVAQE